MPCPPQSSNILDQLVVIHESVPDYKALLRQLPLGMPTLLLENDQDRCKV